MSGEIHPFTQTPSCRAQRQLYLYYTILFSSFFTCNIHVFLNTRLLPLCTSSTISINKKTGDVLSTPDTTVCTRSLCTLYIINPPSFSNMFVQDFNSTEYVSDNVLLLLVWLSLLGLLCDYFYGQYRYTYFYGYRGCYGHWILIAALVSLPHQTLVSPPHFYVKTTPVHL